MSIVRQIQKNLKFAWKMFEQPIDASQEYYLSIDHFNPKELLISDFDIAKKIGGDYISTPPVHAQFVFGGWNDEGVNIYAIGSSLDELYKNIFESEYFNYWDWQPDEVGLTHNPELSDIKHLLEYWIPSTFVDSDSSEGNFVVDLYNQLTILEPGNHGGDVLFTTYEELFEGVDETNEITIGDHVQYLEHDGVIVDISENGTRVSISIDGNPLNFPTRMIEVANPGTVIVDRR